MYVLCILHIGVYSFVIKPREMGNQVSPLEINLLEGDEFEPHCQRRRLLPAINLTPRQYSYFSINFGMLKGYYFLLFALLHI
jgi:hypothetical protein